MVPLQDFIPDLSREVDTVAVRDGKKGNPMVCCRDWSWNDPR